MSELKQLQQMQQTNNEGAEGITLWKTTAVLLLVFLIYINKRRWLNTVGEINCSVSSTSSPLTKIKRKLFFNWSSVDTTGGEPRAVQIVIANEDHTFSLNEAALSKVLMHDDIKDRYVVVVSVAGTYRQGKSFLLNFFLRYMKSTYILKDDEGDWLGLEDVPLDGFSWRGGCNRNTTGIYMWSEVFLTETLTGDKVAVIFLDTQGTFDHESTMKDCAQIFALSTMVSSVQIYNLSQDIFAYDLHHLQYFTEYGRLTLEDTGDVPFQKLQFLVRDWKFPYNYKYGEEGGRKLLDEKLKLKDDQHRDIKTLRYHIKTCFDEIGCFLMPHPGLIVASSPTFSGNLSDINTEFKDNLRDLVPMLLASENLILKKIYGQEVRAGSLVEYFKSYIKIFRGNELPKPKTAYDATAKANNISALRKAKEMYVKSMKSACGDTKPHLTAKEMEAVNKKAMEEALHIFRSIKKMGGNQYSKRYEERLKKDIEETFKQFEATNENKNFLGKVAGYLLFAGLTVTSLTTVGLTCRLLYVGAEAAALGVSVIATACGFGANELRSEKKTRTLLKWLGQPEVKVAKFILSAWRKVKEEVIKMHQRQANAPNNRQHYT